MMHDDLLDIASYLAQLEKGKPRQTSLRRAISSAYYALFHAPIYRSLDHGRAKDVFKRISSHRSSGVAIIGQIFILLQERRHTADYDPSPFTYGRAETLDLIEQSRQAIEQISKLSDGDRLFVATQLVARTRP